MNINSFDHLIIPLVGPSIKFSFSLQKMVLKKCSKYIKKQYFLSTIAYSFKTENFCLIIFYRSVVLRVFVDIHVFWFNNLAIDAQLWKVLHFFKRWTPIDRGWIHNRNAVLWARQNFLSSIVHMFLPFHKKKWLWKGKGLIKLGR